MSKSRLGPSSSTDRTVLLAFLGIEIKAPILVPVSRSCLCRVIIICFEIGLDRHTMRLEEDWGKGYGTLLPKLGMYTLGTERDLKLCV